MTGIWQNRKHQITAKHLLERYTDQNFSPEDTVSFTVMP